MEKKMEKLSEEMLENVSGGANGMYIPPDLPPSRFASSPATDTVNTPNSVKCSVGSPYLRNKPHA